jgi:hypothetical protein
MGSKELSRSKDVTANSTEKSGKEGKASPRPWELKPYLYEGPKDAKMSWHSDPRLESHGQHLDGFIPSDGDHQSLHPAFGFDATPDLSARASSASDQGTLAGGRFSPSAPQLGERPVTNAWLDGAVKKRGGTRTETQPYPNHGYRRYYQE